MKGVVVTDGLVREVETGAPYFASPLVEKGVVFAADFAGRVRAFRNLTELKTK